MCFQNSQEKSKVLKRSSRFFLFTTLHDWTSHISHPSSTEELHTISSEHNNQSYSHQKVFLTASSESCHYDYAWKIKSQGIKSDLQKSEVDFFPLPLPRAPAGREGSFVIDNNKVLSILSKCIQHIIPLQYSISCNPLFILSKQILLSQYTRAVERVAIHRDGNCDMESTKLSSHGRTLAKKGITININQTTKQAWGMYIHACQSFIFMDTPLFSLCPPYSPKNPLHTW